jgi:hypothetical protein
MNAEMANPSRPPFAKGGVERLSEHFSLAELVESDTALRMGIANTPSHEVIENLRRTAALGEMIRAALSNEARREVFIFTLSGFRCEALERVITQKDYAAWCARHDLDAASNWSMYFSKKGHPQGKCLDFRAARFGTPRRIVEFIAAQPEIMAQIDQIIMEGTWVHVSWSDAPRHEVMTAMFDVNGVPSYTMGVA